MATGSYLDFQQQMIMAIIPINPPCSLFLLNDGGQEVELSGDNSVALNAVLS